jgi:hypothetical protein
MANPIGNNLSAWPSFRKESSAIDKPLEQPNEEPVATEKADPSVKKARIAQTQKYILSNLKYPADFLPQLLKTKKVILVGEHHFSESEPVRQSIKNSLSRMKKAGLTHVLLERSSSYQKIIDQLDFNRPDIAQELDRLKVLPVGWGKGDIDILVETKRLGLSVFFIDSSKDGDDQHSAAYENMRDAHMMDIIRPQLGNNSKILIFIGNAHVQKKIVEAEGRMSAPIERIGSRLAREIGAEAVCSIREVLPEEQFDSLLDFMSTSVHPMDIKTGLNKTVILPDAGPLKGDPRVSAADYIITEIK